MRCTRCGLPVTASVVPTSSSTSPANSLFTEVANLAPCALPEGAQRVVEREARAAIDALGLDTTATHTVLNSAPPHRQPAGNCRSAAGCHGGPRDRGGMGRRPVRAACPRRRRGHAGFARSDADLRRLPGSGNSCPARRRQRRTALAYIAHLPRGSRCARPSPTTSPMPGSSTGSGHRYRRTDPARCRTAESHRRTVAVTRSFQLTRAVAGGSVRWLGRPVRTGEGEGPSGLRFDTAFTSGAGKQGSGKVH
jgi:hypothetical protein